MKVSDKKTVENFLRYEKRIFPALCIKAVLYPDGYIAENRISQIRLLQSVRHKKRGTVKNFFLLIVTKPAKIKTCFGNTYNCRSGLRF